MHSAIVDSFKSRCSAAWTNDGKLMEMYPPLRIVIKMCARPHIQAIVELLRCDAWLSDDMPIDPPGDEFFLSERCIPILQPPRPRAAVSRPRPAAPTWLDVVPRDVVGIVFRDLRVGGQFAGWPHGAIVKRSPYRFSCSWNRYGVPHRRDCPATVILYSRVLDLCGVAIYSHKSSVPLWGSTALRRFDSAPAFIALIRNDSTVGMPAWVGPMIILTRRAIVIDDESEDLPMLISLRLINAPYVAIMHRVLR